MSNSYFGDSRAARRSRRRWRRRIRARIYAWLTRLALAWVGITVLVVLLFRWVDPPTSAFMIAAQIRGGEITRNEWLDWDRVPPELALAVVAAEDQRFPTHYGFDFVEIQDALESALNGKRMRGASTISQQVAKNLFLWSGRNFVRKGLEAYFTVLLEVLWPKQRILEIYLNIAQFGDGLYGITAASGVYFGKSPGELSRYEISLLASVLPNPASYKPNAPSESLLNRAAFVRRHMQSLGGTGYITNM